MKKKAVKNKLGIAEVVICIACHPACPPVEEVSFDEGSPYFKSEKQGCFAGKKTAQHDKKKTGRQFKSEEVLVKVDLTRDLLKEV